MRSIWKIHYFLPAYVDQLVASVDSPHASGE
jgi:hypothetical protein